MSVTMSHDFPLTAKLTQIGMKPVTYPEFKMYDVLLVGYVGGWTIHHVNSPYALAWANDPNESILQALRMKDDVLQEFWLRTPEMEKESENSLTEEEYQEVYAAAERIGIARADIKTLSRTNSGYWYCSDSYVDASHVFVNDDTTKCIFCEKLSKKEWR